MTNHRSTQPPGWIVLTLVAGTVLSMAVFGLLRRWERLEAEKRVSEIVHKEVEKLQVSMLRSMETLYSIASWRAAKGAMDPGVFREFVANALERQPELLALSWNPIVKAEERAKFEQMVGRPIREWQVGALSMAQRRSEFVPVAVIEPFVGNEPAIGYDLASDPLRREALEKARDLGKPVATAPIRLAQGSEEGVLVVLPVFGKGAANSVSERREKIEGYAVAVFRVRDLVSGALVEFGRRGIEVGLRDLTSERAIIEPAISLGERLGAVELNFAEHRWSLSYTVKDLRTGWQALGALVGGLAFTAMATACLWLGWMRAREIAVAKGRLEIEVIERQRAEEKAARASEAKSDFLASMSHELRTPLNAILGYAQLMQKDPLLGPDHRDSAMGISSSGRHLLGLINEVLDLSKIEAGRMELNPIDFSLTSFGESIEATFRPLCAQKKIGLRVVVKEGKSACLRGDEGKLRQILINLLGNAVKFTTNGEVFLGIAKSENDLWSFEVIDTGMGIPEEEHAQLFEPFHQGKTPLRHGGTGLGLAIARRQVELMGGKLSFETKRGIGTRFFFSIHLVSADGPVVTREVDLTPPAFEVGPVQLPPELMARLMIAAELHSATALKNCLTELRTTGEQGTRLAEALRELMRCYDMEGIQRLLAQATRTTDVQHELK